MRSNPPRPAGAATVFSVQPMKTHILQHVPFEGIGCMADWLAERDARIGYTRFFQDPELPSLEGLDLLIAMGGPMSVNDETELPWLAEEKRFVRQAVEQGLPVLGVCLGAQLIASALGAKVYPGPHKEIGWLPIRGLPDPGFAFPARARVFHWHGETFDLPPGAVRLAESAACANQAFRIGERVMGLQFHLETTPESADAILNNCRDELAEAPYIQSEAEIRGVGPAVYSEANALMRRVLESITGD